MLAYEIFGPVIEKSAFQELEAAYGALSEIPVATRRNLASNPFIRDLFSLLEDEMRYREAQVELHTDEQLVFPL